MSNKKKRRSGHKVPVSAQTAPPPEKIPRGDNPDFAKSHPVWSFSILDLYASVGGWVHLSFEKHDLDGLLKRLSDLEKMTWAEIAVESNKQNHFVDVDKCITAAQDRLKVLKLDDHDRLFSLRVESKVRVYGILDRATFRILWWDPVHAICPSKKKHT